MSDPAGLAALAICESMLLTLAEAGIIDKNETKALLEDAAAVLRNAVRVTDGATDYREAAALIERMIAGRDPVRPQALSGARDGVWADRQEKGRDPKLTLTDPPG